MIDSNVKKILFLVFFLNASFSVLAQSEPPDPCTDGSQNTCTCETSPTLCTLEDLNEYQYEMTTFDHPDDGPEPMCEGPEGDNTASHNPTWFAFIAWCTDLTIQVQYINCTDEGGIWDVCAGIQAAVYEDCSLDPSSAIACDTSVDGCDGDDTRIVDVEGMTLGETYYFLVDGCCGSACDIKITVIGDCGVTQMGEWEQEIQGPCTICEPGTATFSVTDHVGAVNYHWFVDDVSEQVEEDGLTFDYTFPSAGVYTICVDVDNEPCIDISDAPAELCKTVTVLDTEADAGNMEGGTACPGGTITYSATGYAVSDFMDQWVFVVDATGEILQADEGDSGSFTYDYCGTFSVYSYNFYNDSTFTIPVIGENFNDFETCNDCFCDLDVALLTFEDTSPPTFDSEPADITINCFDGLDPMEDLAFTDDCMGAGFAEGVEEGMADLCDGGSYTRTWTMVDSCGNSVSYTQNIEVEQVPQAEFTNIPDDENLSCADLIDGQVSVDYTNNGAGDCLIEGSVLGTTDDDIDFCGGEVTFTWTFEDDCGREITETQLVTIDPPLDIEFIDVPDDVTITCDDLPFVPVNLDYTNNDVGVCLIDGNQAPSIDGDLLICGDQITITWEVTDDCGRMFDATQMVTLEDTEEPEFIDAPSDETYDCHLDVPAMEDVEWMDNCDGAGFVSGTEDGTIDVCTGGVITRTWEYTDDCDLTVTHIQTITVNPVPDVDWTSTLPEDITVQCDESLPAIVDLDYSNSSPSTNCLEEGSVSPVEAGELIICGDQITRTWEFTPSCGPAISHVQTITLEDMDDPEFTDPPMDETYDCYLDVPDMTDLEWTDVCDGTGSVTGIESGTIDECTGGTLTRTWEYTDACDNMVGHVQTITVNPVPDVDWTSTLPEDITVQCGESLPPLENLDYSNDSPSTNCLEEGSASPSEMGELLVCGDQITRTWEHTPACGPAISHTQTITLEDVEFPVFVSPPADETFDCYLDVPAAPDLTWTDNCDGSDVVSAVEDGTIDDCTGGTLTRTWEYTDACDNTTTHVQTITVNPIPDIDWTSTLPEDITVDCGEVFDPAVNLNYSNEAVSGCLEMGVVPAVEMGELIVCGDQIIRTWDVTPACGPALSHTQTITLEDTELPVFINPPGDATYECYLDVPDAIDLEWTDNCDGTDMVSPTEDGTIDQCTGGTLTRTWEYTDACDNTATHVQTITVNPVPDADWTSSLPADITVQCGEVIDPAVELNYSNEAVSGCLEEGVIPPVEMGELLVCGDQIIRTWDVTPACGPALSHTQTITLEDTELPVFLNPPANETYNCYLDVPDAIDLTATDNCDDDQIITPTETGTIEDCIGGSITRTWEATDACGNVQTHDQIITVNPVPDITWTSSLPSDITVQCDVILDPPVDLNYSNNAESACLEEDIVSAIEEGELVVCGDQITRTWEVVPVCGATLTYIQTITLEDITPPSFVSTPDASIIISCLADLPPLEDLEYEDNCDENAFATPIETGILDPCTGGSISRTWEATDLCGNGPVVFTQVITLTAPTETACDDLDDCTINDMWVLDCEGNVCVPCTGQITGCDGVTEIVECDDDDPCTINDMQTVACDGSICVPCMGELTDCDNGITFNVVCDDDDPCTINDIEVVDCQDNVCIPCIGEPNPTPDPDILPPDPVCLGENGIITVVGCTGGNVIWYDDPDGTNLVNVGNTFLVTGLTDDATFYVECDLNGCVSNLVSVTIEVNVPITTTITGDDLICDGEVAVLDAGEGFIDYDWVGGGSQIHFVTETGTYVVTVTDINGCTSTADFEVTVVPNPEVDILGSTTFCTDGSTVLSVDDLFDSYAWDPNGESSTSITVNTPGTYTITVTDEFGCTGTSSVEVIESTELNPVIVGGPGFCSDDDLSLSAGEGFADYMWAPNGETSFEINVSEAGTYSVTVEDINGCTGTSSIDVFVFDSPTAVINGPNILCPGDEILLDGFGPGLVAWSWSSGNIGPAIFVDEAGEYTVTATDENGCTATTSVMVEAHDAPEPMIEGDPTFCQGGSTILNVTEVFSTYEWSINGESDMSIEVDESTTLSVTVTDENGCTGSSSIFVTVDPPSTVLIGGSTSFCTNSSTLLDAGEWESQVWLPTNETTQTIEVSTEGEYTLVVTDENGCTASSVVQVTEETELSPIISGDLSGCTNSLVNLFVSGNFDTYEWSTGEMTSNVTVAVGSSYSVTVTDNSGCSGNSQVDIIALEAEQVEINGETAFCQGLAGELTASDGFDTYEWSNSVNNQSITIADAGTYSVTATDVNGCTSESSIMVELIDQASPNIVGDTDICLGETLMLESDAEYTMYEWSTGETTAGIEISTGGSYSLTVTDGNGCTGSSAVIVDQFSLPTVAILGSSSFCTNGFTTLSLNNDFVNIMWGPNGETSNEIQVNQEGAFTVTVTDENGCTASSSIDVTEEESLSPSIDGPDFICAGGTAILDAGVFTSFEWSTGETESSIEVGSPGTYAVTVYDQSGCSGNTSIEIEEITAEEVNIGGDPYICSGTNTELTAEGNFVAYNWSNGFNTQSIIVNLEGDYTVTVTDNNGCTSSTSINIGTVDNPDPNISGNPFLCPGESGTFGLDQNYVAYEWSTGETTETIDIDVIGLYNVTVTDINGCTASTSIDIFNHPPFSLTIGGSTAYCPMGFTILDGSGDDYVAWEWSTGETSPAIQVNTEDSFSLTVTDVNGCTASSSVDVSEEDSLMPVILGDLLICQGQSTILDGGSAFASWEWSTGESTQTIEVSDAGVYSITVSDGVACTGEGEVELVVIEPTVPEITGPAFICSGGESTLTAETGFFSYEWSTGEFSSIITVNEGGIYSLTVTDTEGCEGVNTFELDVQDVPDVFIEDIDCAEDKLTYDVYFQTNADQILLTDYSVDDLGMGDYLIAEVDTSDNLIITFINNETLCDTTIVINAPNCGCQVLADPGVDQIIDCDVTSAILGGENTSEGTNVSYAWFDEDGNLVSNDPMFITEEGGVYTLFVYDDVEGCDVSASVTITDISNNPLTEIIAEPGTVIDCVIDTVSLSFTSEDNVVYTWIVNDQNTAGDTITITESSEIILIALDTLTNCSSEAVLSIEDQEDYPIIQIEDPDSFTCLIDTVIIDASNSQSGQTIVYQWFDSDGNAIEGAINTTLIITEPGVYFFEAQDLELGCSNLDSIIVGSNLAEPTLDLADEAFLPCDQDDLSLDISVIGNSPHEYIWSTNDGSILMGENTDSPTINESGWYYVTVTNTVNGCSAMDSIFVDVNDIPDGFDSSISQPQCVDENDGSITVSVSSGGTAPFTYFLNGEENTTGIFNDLGPGEYDIVVVDDAGCEYTSSFSLDEPLPVLVNVTEPIVEVNYNDGTIIELITNVDPGSIDQIIWDPPLDFPCDNCLTIPIDSITNNQTYLITLIDENGCSDTTLLRLLVDREIDIYIPNVISTNDNSENGVFFPQTGYDDVEVLDMFIYDRWGELIYHAQNFFSNQAEFGWDGTFNNRDVVSGVYVYYLRFNVPGVGELKRVGDVTVIK